MHVHVVVMRCSSTCPVSVFCAMHRQHARGRAPARIGFAARSQSTRRSSRLINHSASTVSGRHGDDTQSSADMRASNYVKVRGGVCTSAKAALQRLRFSVSESRSLPSLPVFPSVNILRFSSSRRLGPSTVTPGAPPRSCYLTSVFPPPSQLALELLQAPQPRRRNKSLASSACQHTGALPRHPCRK